MSNPNDDPTKLNNQLIQLLEGLNNRKSRIDEQVKFLTNLPKILPFDPLPPEKSLVSRKTWEKWWSEHDQIEKEAGIFREDEFALMKEVAMSKTTNMSREDTDVVGLTLCTLEAFSKLEHLLRSRRKQIQILDLRIKWDHQTGKVWQDLQALESHLPKILSKIRWNPLARDMDHQIDSAIASPHFNPSPLPGSPPILSCSNPSPPDPKSPGPLSRSLPSQKAVCDDFSDSGPSNLKPRPSDPNCPDTIAPSLDSSTNFSSLISRSQPQLIQSSPKPSPSARFSRMNSLPAFNTTYPSAITVSSSYSSPQSKAMRIQSLTLQLTSITSQFHTLSRAVALTSTTIDQLIDSSLHVPVVFLDMQDKLEAAVRSLQPIETAQFFHALMEQYREADDVWFNLFNLGIEIESYKREISALIADSHVDQDHLVNFERQFDLLSRIHQTHHLRTQLRVLPSHSNYPEQSKCNTVLIEKLIDGSERIRSRLDELNDSITIYRSATDALRESDRLRRSMEECKQDLLALIQAIDNLNQRYPNRPWLMNGPDCLTPCDKEKEYETEWNKIVVELNQNSLTGLNLLETTKGGMMNLNAAELNPSIKSEFQKSRHGLDKVIEQAQHILISKVQSIKKLSQIRATWGQLLDFQTEMRRLGDRMTSDAHREKWRAKKASSSSPAIPTEELDATASLHPSRLHSYQEVKKYLLESIQPLINTTLAQLNNDEQTHAVHQHFSEAFGKVLNFEAPHLARLEQMIQQICLQTSQVRKIENEYDAKVIEGGRWMKKLQGLIGVKLEHTYEEIDESTSITGLEARVVEKSRCAEVLAQLTNFSHGLDLFCDSLSNRISFITKNVADHLAMQDGRVVLDCEAHDQSVRAHLNVLSMNLMSLKDQISNESILLQWINSSHADEFEQAVNNVRNDIKMADAELEQLEAHIQRAQNLIESDVDEPALTSEQLEQTIDQPLRDLRTALEQIENRLSESASVQLEAFIASCPSSSSSQAFKPDQFILPKQMSQHQLQSLYNHTSRRFKDIHTLALKFKNETNRKRKNEFAWRHDWARDVDELTKDCEKLQLETVTISAEITNLGNESADWQKNRFKPIQLIELEELNNRTPTFLNELTLYELRLSQSLASLRAFENKINLVHERALAVRGDIEAKLPVFIHLITDLTTLTDQLSCRWQKSCEVGMHVTDSVNQLKECVESFTKELERRISWKARCHQIADASLESVRESLIQFDDALDQLSSPWGSFDEGKSSNETLQILFSFLSRLRSLHESKASSFASIKCNIEAVQKKLLIIHEEIISLSVTDVPHKYFTEAQFKLNKQLQRLEECSKNLDRTEDDLLTSISRLHSRHDFLSTEELENMVISKHYDLENARLTDWSQLNLGQFIDSVQAESQQIEKWSDEICLSQTHIVGQPQSSTPSAQFIESLTDTDSEYKDQIVKAADMLKLTSDTARRLQILNRSRIELAREIVFFRRTLPSRCNNRLDAILRHSHTEVDVNEPNRFQVACSKLQESESSIAILVRFWEERLARAKENSIIIQEKTHLMNTCSRLSKRLNQVDIDEWIDGEFNSQHSPLPNPNQLEQVSKVLEETSNEIEELSNVRVAMEQSCLRDTLDLLEDRKQKVEVLRQLVDVQSATLTCDQSFSALLDTLDSQRKYVEKLEVSEPSRSAFEALETLIKASKKIEKDPRVQYHLNRSRETWEELTSMMKDKADGRKEDQESQNRNYKPHSMSTLPLPVRLNHHLGDVMNTPPSISRRQRPSIVPRLKHSSDNVIERIERSSIPVGLMESPSYMASHRHGKRAPDPFDPRVKSRLPTSETLSSRLFTQRPMSGEDKREKNFHSISSTSSQGVKERPRVHSVLGTTPSCSVNKSLTSSPNASFTATPYKPQSNRNIDKLVGKVVNRLARNKLKVHVAPAAGWEDNSGMYWIGEKVYFCRILRSQTVMVRIGGGWCELSAFIIEHLRLKTSKNVSRLELRTAGGSEKSVQVGRFRRSSIGHCSSSNLLLPTSSVVTSCHSSPSNTFNRSPRAFTDASTSSTPASSITTVLITTPQEIRISSHPTHFSHNNEQSNRQHTSSIQNGNSLLSSPTDTVQMFFRKAENRNYFSNNYSPHQHLHPVDGMMNDSVIQHKSINRRTSFSPASSPKLDPSCLSFPASNNNINNVDNGSSSSNNNNISISRASKHSSTSASKKLAS